MEITITALLCSGLGPCCEFGHYYTWDFVLHQKRCMF